jgi:ATP-dependent DNA helicase RecG
MSKYILTKIEFLKGVGPIKASLLNKELGIFNYGELIKHLPYRLKKSSPKKSPLKRGFK